MAVELGAFVTHDAEQPQRTVEIVVPAQAAGLDLVGIQDHPYQRRFLDRYAARVPRRANGADRPRPRRGQTCRSARPRCWLRVTGRLADGWLPSVPRMPVESSCRATA